MQQPEAIIQPYLTDGEQLLYAAKPERPAIFEPLDWIAVPVTLALGIFLLVTAFAPFAGGIDRGIGFLSLFGLVFVLLAVYFIGLRFWFRRARKLHDVYAVTDQRIILLHTLREPQAESIPRAQAAPRVRGRDIVLGQTNAWGDLYYALGLDLFFRFSVSKTPVMYGVGRSEAARKALHIE